MRNFTVLAAGVLTLVAGAKADIVTIEFDQLQVGEDVLNYYNGGFGSLGTGPGPSFGVIFAPGWIAQQPDVYGSPNGKSAVISGQAIMDVPAGWFGLLSFYYMGSPLVVDFYDQQGGLGNLVGTLNLPAEGSFFPAGDDLPIFRSAVFTASGDSIDALTNGATVISEPGTLQLLIVGMTAFGITARNWSRRRETVSSRCSYHALG